MGLRHPVAWRTVLKSDLYTYNKRERQRKIRPALCVVEKEGERLQGGENSVLQCVVVCCNVCVAVESERLQGGEDPWDALSCRSFFAKEPLIVGLFCRK